MQNNTTKVVHQTSFSFPILGVLGVVFVTLKLLGHINWAWLWVLAPFWVPFAIAAAVILGGLLIMLIVYLFGSVTGKKRRTRHRSRPRGW